MTERIARAMSQPGRIAESLRFRRTMRLEAGVPAMGVAGAAIAVMPMNIPCATDGLKS